MLPLSLAFGVASGLGAIAGLLRRHRGRLAVGVVRRLQNADLRTHRAAVSGHVGGSCQLRGR
ncbi:hypothetical protein [Candidatus Poriferisodalis sp.]|uniref:hypothetical protein n=1 Tax=Candidatus Poriferisodalis sp. TaxID=3101277 RepID=UPI003C6F6731